MRVLIFCHSLILRVILMLQFVLILKVLITEGIHILHLVVVILTA